MKLIEKGQVKIHINCSYKCSQFTLIVSSFWWNLC